MTNSKLIIERVLDTINLVLQDLIKLKVMLNPNLKTIMNTQCPQLDRFKHDNFNIINSVICLIESIILDAELKLKDSAKLELKDSNDTQ